MQKRLGDLLADNEMALADLEAASEIARLLPATGWKKRISENTPANAAEQFSARFENLSHQRANDPQSVYNLQAELYPATDEMRETGEKLKALLNDLGTPLTKLAGYLQRYGR